MNIAGILSLVFGIIWILVGIFTLIPLVFGVMDIIIFIFCKKIIELIDQRRYQEAKDKTLIWMILGIILGGFIPGIILLVAYLKYDELLRTTAPPPPPYQQNYQQTSPPASNQQYQQPPQKSSKEENEEENLRKLKKLKDEGLISEEEYETKKKEILEKL